MVFAPRFMVPMALVAAYAFSVFAQQDSLTVYAPLPELMRSQIERQQRLERMNLVVDSLSNERTCDQITDLSTKEREYCHSRFTFVHPEAE